MTIYKFNPNFETVAKINGTVSIADLEQERGVYSATPEFIKLNCGPIANRLLNMVPKSYYDEASQLGLYPNCDIRIHRLYPGDIPAYPGWHCDDEFRETYFAQPDLNKIKVSKHLTCTVSTDEYGVSNTQFLNEDFECNVESPNSEVTLWGQVHEQLEIKKK